MSTPADAVLEVLFTAVYWLGRALPRIPAAWLATVNGVVSDAAELVSGIPYLSLLPWSTIGAVGTGLPVVLALSIVLRTLSRVFAWFRSRGISDQ